MLAWKIAPALACGNTVVLKPAETTPLSALLFSWRAVRRVKGHAIVMAHRHELIGRGAGQPSRVVSVEVARPKAGERAPL